MIGAVIEFLQASEADRMMLSVQPGIGVVVTLDKGMPDGRVTRLTQHVTIAAIAMAANPGMLDAILLKRWLKGLEDVRDADHDRADADGVAGADGVAAGAVAAAGDNQPASGTRTVGLEGGDGPGEADPGGGGEGGTD